MKEISVSRNDANQRLDKFLTKAFPNLKKSMMYKALRNKKIKVNRKRAEYSQILQEGDVILLFLPEDALTTQSAPKKPGPESAAHQTDAQVHKPDSSNQSPKIKVVFENNDLLIVFKPKGLLSQKDSPKDQNTMADQIIEYLTLSKSYDPKKELSFVPAAVSRLDRNTEGLCAAGKNAESLRLLNECMRTHSLHKFYLARVQGILDKDTYQLRLYLKKEGTVARVFTHECPASLNADLNIRVISRSEQDTLIEAELLTGRFHQIRATLAFLGHPLIGDHKYGYQGKCRHQQLCAYRLDFSDTPFAGQIEQVTLRPADISWIRKEEYALIDETVKS